MQADENSKPSRYDVNLYILDTANLRYSIFFEYKKRNVYIWKKIMIQRIQTIYLFVSVVIIGIIAYLLQQQMQFMDGNYALAILSALGLIFLLNLFTILMFKSRKLQSSLLQFSLIIQFITVAGMAYGMLQLKYPILIPICVTSAVVICTVLARKGILADEKIVRSMDRLR